MPPKQRTATEIAEIFDVDIATVRRWHRAGLPHQKSKKGKRTNWYDEAEVSRWLTEKGLTGNLGKPASPDMAALKLRKEAALAERYERQNLVESGKLIDRAEAQSRIVSAIAAAASRLSSLGAVLSPQLEGMTPAERQTLIDGKVEDVLRELSTTNF